MASPTSFEMPKMPKQRCIEHALKLSKQTGFCPLGFVSCSICRQLHFVQRGSCVPAATYAKARQYIMDLPIEDLAEAFL